MCPPNGPPNGHVRVASRAEVRKAVPDICKKPVRSYAVRCAGRRARKRAALRPRADNDDLLIFLDWDDTILPTSYLALHELGLESTVPEELVERFEEYAKCVSSTVRLLKKFGRLLIVTNAETGWVELTCAKFLPDLVPAIADLPRVSARSEYEPKGFQGPVQWKTEAFVAQMENHFAVKRDQYAVLSVGDANHERFAVQTAAHRLEMDAKSIKLIEKPDLEILQREHELLQHNFPHLQGLPALDVRLDDI